MTKIFIAIFAPDERLPSSATLDGGDGGGDCDSDCEVMKSCVVLVVVLMVMLVVVLVVIFQMHHGTGDGDQTS